MCTCFLSVTLIINICRVFRLTPLQPANYWKELALLFLAIQTGYFSFELPCFFGYFVYFFLAAAEHPLFFECAKLVQIEAERGKHHFDTNSGNGCYPDMTRIEHILYHGIRPFNRCPFPAYSLVAQLIIDAYRMASSSLFHCGIVAR